MDEKCDITLLERLCSESMLSATDRSLEKIIADAFHNHFGYDIALANKDELHHLTSEGSDIQSFLYRNETFLYITDYEIDSILCDKDGAKVTMKMKYKFV